MPSITRILVPVDFSSGAREAVRYARFLAEPFGAQLDLLHVWEPSPYITPSEIIWLSSSEDQDEFATRMRRDLTEKLETFAKEELGSSEGLGMYVEAGYPSHSILEWLESKSYDLAVLGTHGRTGLPHLLMGSVAERIVRTAPCPVLTVRVPKDGQDKSPQPSDT
jgi:nucleotide-binding universal stress UspA family protein